MNWDAIQVWAAIVLLMDASFGLWNIQRFKASMPTVNIMRIALVEVGVALILLMVRYLF